MIAMGNRVVLKLQLFIISQNSIFISKYASGGSPSNGSAPPGTVGFFLSYLSFFQLNAGQTGIIAGNRNFLLLF
jgi:hypothetical protein